jgi:hypothetical protein
MPYQPAVLGTARLNNFRLNYLSADLARVRSTKVRILLAGQPVRVRIAGFQIIDAINDTPNTCSLTIDGPAPTAGQTLRITINSNAPRLLFNGVIQQDDLTYEGRPTQLAYPSRAVDDTITLVRRRPFGTWVNTSATTIALSIIATYAPGFTATHVQAGLPLVSIIFDGTDDFAVALKRLATAVGGYWYVEDNDVHLFTVESLEVPDPIQLGYPFCDDPPIKSTRDISQLRTRQFGKGHGEKVPIDIAAGETVIPVEDDVMFNPAGGKAIAGTTPDGAQSQIISYTGTVGRGFGSTVGPSLSPSVAPVLTPHAGSGLATGVYQGAYTFVTALGESLPSPLAAVTTGLVPAPSFAPIASAQPSSGAYVDLGTHDYVMTFVMAGGETTPGPLTGPATTSMVPSYLLNPPSEGTSATAYEANTSNLAVGDLVYYGFTYVNNAGETTVGSGSNTIVIGAGLPVGGVSHAQGAYCTVPTSLPPGATAIKAYRNRNGTWDQGIMAGSIAFQPGGTIYDNGMNNYVGSPPGSNTALVPATYKQQVLVQNLPISAHPAVTARKLYRRFNGTGPFKLAQTIANNTDGYVYDTTANASLGAAAPSSNTALAAQIAVAGIATGPSGTIARKYYRTTVNGSQLKLQQTIADNTTTVGVVDATPDASLGANAPINNTSGLGSFGGAGLDTGFYTAAPVTFAADGSASGATGSTPLFTAGSYVFVAADVGARLYIQSGTNWTPGFYTIASVSAGLARLDRACATVANPTAGRWGVDYSTLPTPRVVFADLVIDATTTTKFTSAAFPVGPNYIGNVVSISNGVGFSDQFVAVISVSGLTATCDKVLGTAGSTGGRAVLGGAAAVPFVYAGSSTLITGSTGPFRAGGGWVQIGQQLVRYTGTTGNTLTGIPPVGTPGALLDTVGYGEPVYVVPSLTGVTGLALPMLRGTPVHIWVQRDDLAAQAEQATIDAATGRVPADGIYEGPVIVDERRGEASLTAICDATLRLFSRPIVTVAYATRDVKTKSGKPITVDLASPPIHETLTIQDVTITEVDIAPGLAPKFTASATTWRASLEDLLRRMMNTLEAQ